MPGELRRHELDLIAQNYFQQLGHDSQHRIFKFFAWDAVAPVSDRRGGQKAKGGAERPTIGGYTDYPKLASAKLDKMTTAEIAKFLLACALASELYFPTYYGATSSKDTKLAREAVQYKVNCDRVLRGITNKLMPKPAKPRPDSKLQTSAKSSGKGKPK